MSDEKNIFTMTENEVRSELKTMQEKVDKGDATVSEIVRFKMLKVAVKTFNKIK